MCYFLKIVYKCSALVLANRCFRSRKIVLFSFFVSICGFACKMFVALLIWWQQTGSKCVRFLFVQSAIKIVVKMVNQTGLWCSLCNLCVWSDLSSYVFHVEMYVCVRGRESCLCFVLLVKFISIRLIINSCMIDSVIYDVFGVWVYMVTCALINQFYFFSVCSSMR